MMWQIHHDGKRRGGRAFTAQRIPHRGDWGVQGLLIKLLFLGAAIAAALRTCKHCRLEGRTEDALMGMCMISAATGTLVACLFGSYLANEWNYWLAVFLVRYSELYRVGAKDIGTIPASAQVDIAPEPGKLAEAV